MTDQTNYFTTRLTEAEKHKHPGYASTGLTIPIRKYKNDANGITRAVIDLVKAHGWQAERINSMGRQIDRRKTYTDVVGFQRTIGSIEWIPGTGQKGTADIHASIPLNGSNGFAVSVKIEIKAGKDRQRTEQKEYQQMIQQAGGVYIIVRHIDGFVTWLLENADMTRATWPEPKQHKPLIDPDPQRLI